MAVEYEWSFPQFDVQSADGLTNIVRAIHWRLTAHDNENFMSTTCGVMECDAPNANSFIPFEQLTKQWAIGVVSSVINVPVLMQQLADDIELQKNPPVRPVTPPWSA